MSAKSSDTPPPRLTTVAAAGFKSIRDRVHAEIRPLTLLAGANSSGKSSLMQPLLLLKQTLEAGFDAGPLRLDGPNARFTNMQQLLWHGKQKKDHAAEFEVGLGNGRTEVSLFFKSSTKKLALDRSVFRRAGESDVQLRVGDSGSSMTLGFLAAGIRPMVYQVTPNGCWPELKLSSSWEAPAVTFLEKPTESHDAILRNLIHLPGLRGNPERLYRTSNVGARFPGQFHDYVAGVIAFWAAAKDARLEQVANGLQQLGLAWKVEARPVELTHVELRVSRTASPQQGGAQDLVNIADVGFGVGQVLPVVVALAAAHRDQVVYVEQPEIHLHPRAQVALARLLLQAAARGVVVVAETHSNLLLKGVQQAVASREFAPDLVKLHWFQRDEKTGASRCLSADLDESGAYGNWPEDLSDVELDIEDQFLSSSMGRRGK